MDRAFQRIRSLMLRGTFYSVPPNLSNKYLSANKDYITELGLKKSSAWLIPTHSIIYSNGATIGANSKNKYPVFTKQGILGSLPNKNIDVEILYYCMQTS